MRPPTVVEQLHLQLVVPGQPGLPMTADLRYDTSDPYAVHATFRADGSEVTWVLARELLMAGLREPCGQGDVQVRPGEDQGKDDIVVQLSSPDGVAVLLADGAGLRGFLLRTCDHVPPGSESRFLDIDVELAQLLA
jgi:hypothetical protein